MQAVLVTFKADGERRSFSLPREVTVIGRREDCDLRIPLSEVSRKHCRFLIENDTLKLEDLGSSNGTFHNGQRIQQAVVQAGDTVQVGPVVFIVQIDGVPADDEIQPLAANPDSDTSVGAKPPAELPPEAPDGATAEDDVVDLALEEAEDQQKPQQ
jgi:pSer/pThr/pTyr-binding forkhead associated (FHA) protein